MGCSASKNIDAIVPNAYGPPRSNSFTEAIVPNAYRPPRSNSFTVFDINASEETWLKLENGEGFENQQKPSHVPTHLLEKLDMLGKEVSNGPGTSEEVSEIAPIVVSKLEPKPGPKLGPEVKKYFSFSTLENKEVSNGPDSWDEVEEIKKSRAFSKPEPKPSPESDPEVKKYFSFYKLEKEVSNGPSSWKEVSKALEEIKKPSAISKPEPKPDLESGPEMKKYFSFYKLEKEVSDGPGSWEEVSKALKEIKNPSAISKPESKLDMELGPEVKKYFSFYTIEKEVSNGPRSWEEVSKALEEIMKLSAVSKPEPKPSSQSGPEVKKYFSFHTLEKEVSNMPRSWEVSKAMEEIKNPCVVSKPEPKPGPELGQELKKYFSFYTEKEVSNGPCLLEEVTKALEEIVKLSAVSKPEPSLESGPEVKKYFSFYTMEDRVG